MFCHKKIFVSTLKLSLFCKHFLVCVTIVNFGFFPIINPDLTSDPFLMFEFHLNINRGNISEIGCDFVTTIELRMREMGIMCI